MSTPSLDSYYEIIHEELGLRQGNLRFSHKTVFAGVELAGRSLLDIGAGEGELSCYAACVGATRVVALEPEAVGSRPGGVHETFERIRGRLGLEQIALRSETLQEFDAGGERFDVLTSMASINHLDEEACTRLGDDSGAQATYLQILSKLADLAKPGSTLIVCDAARRNLFGDLKLRNPITRTIEWEKHQSPRLWASLLGRVGFVAPRIRWTSFNTLRRPGRFVLGNGVAAYLLTSTFCLTMERG